MRAVFLWTILVLAWFAVPAPSEAQQAGTLDGASSTVVPPPPPPRAVNKPPPNRVVGPLYRGGRGTQPAVTYAAPLQPSGAELLPPAMPFMLGFGYTVLGGLGLAGLTALVVNSDVSSWTGDGYTALGTAYLLGGLLMAGGLYLAFGGLTSEVEVHSWQPGWAWLAAVTSLIGGVTAIGALTTYLVDDDFGDDSVAFAIASGGAYLISLSVFIGFDDTDATIVSWGASPPVAMGPVPPAWRY